VFLHHIPTGQTSRLHTPSNLILNVHLAEGWVVWSEDRTGNWAVYAQDLTTMTEETIASGPSDKTIISSGESLVAWFDFGRGGCDFPCTSYDIVLGDLQTGAHRRLTAEPATWGIHSPTCRWALYTESGPSSAVRVYARDLVAAGVLDQSCHLIPCDPQTEQCAMLEWQGP
jgi:hypothetical protein